MVHTLDGSAQGIESENAALSKRGRAWLLTVATLDVLMVMASMVALNAAVPDIAGRDIGDPVPTHLSGRRLHPGAGLPTTAGRCDRRPVKQARRPARRACHLLPRLHRPTVLDNPMQIIVALSAVTARLTGRLGVPVIGVVVVAATLLAEALASLILR